MGMGLVGGAAVSLVGTSLIPLDQAVGTHASAAGAVLGIGLMAAAVNPAGNVGWVRAGILYGFVVLAFEAGSHFLLGAQFHLGPVIFGLAFSLLLMATYPERKQLIPSTGSTTGSKTGSTTGSKTTVAPPAPAVVKTPSTATNNEPLKQADSEAQS